MTTLTCEMQSALASDPSLREMRRQVEVAYTYCAVRWHSRCRDSRFGRYDVYLTAECDSADAADRKYEAILAEYESARAAFLRDFQQ